jgi:hypothetical protein
MEADKAETSRLPHFLDNRLTDGLIDPRAIVKLERLSELKNPMTSGIETATLRLVA